MTAATASAAFTRPHTQGFLGRFTQLFSHAKRYEQLFEMSDAQLAARGLSRDGLVRSYISGLGLN